MRGEKGNFKSRVFGGFNRHDVIDYIETLAAQRNSLSRDNERLRGRIESLEERLEEALEKTEIVEQPAPETEEQPAPEIGEQPAAGQNLEEARRRLSEAIGEARRILRDVKSQYDSLCTDIKVNTAQAGHELRLISTKLEGLQSSLSAAGERLEAIGAGLEDAENAFFKDEDGE